MSYAKAVERCAARTDGYTEVCPDRWSVPGCYTVNTGGWQGTMAEDERSWLNVQNVTSCRLKAQVMANGLGESDRSQRVLCVRGVSSLDMLTGTLLFDSQRSQ
jgi:hypothetical protein